MLNKSRKICLIGFGEAAQAFAGGWDGKENGTISSYDIKTESDATRNAKCLEYEAHQVRGFDSNTGALENAGLVFSLVTADQAFTAAEQASKSDLQGALWLDCNSCAPDTKRQAAVPIGQAGGRYVDAAIMAPVLPKKHRVPILLSGPDAEDAARALEALGMSPRVVGEEIGKASTIKMLRSVMIKGMEALFAECFLSAKKAGVLGEVVGSLSGSNPNIQWENQGTYNLERMIVHGTRRAAEVEEVAKTVSDLGLSADVTEGTINWQRRVGALGIGARDESLDDRLDRVLAEL